MKKVFAMIFPFSRKAYENLKFLLSLFIYLTIGIVVTVVSLIIIQWVPIISYILIVLASLYALCGIVYSIYLNMQTLK